MRPLVKTAMQSSNATLRKARKELPGKKKGKKPAEPESDDDEPPRPPHHLRNTTEATHRRSLRRSRHLRRDA